MFKSFYKCKGYLRCCWLKVKRWNKELEELDKIKYYQDK